MLPNGMDLNASCIPNPFDQVIRCLVRIEMTTEGWER